jgi:hypothetical protein
MSLSEEIAKQFREIHFGGNWTASNLKDTLEGLTWKEAITPIPGCNTIATLVYHTQYFVHAVLQVLEGQPLNASDKYSFSHPVIQSQDDWQQMLDSIWAEVERFAQLVALLPEEKWWADFSDNKYGHYYRNVHGIIAHTHYHLGQIALIRKLLSQQNQTPLPEN